MINQHNVFIETFEHVRRHLSWRKWLKSSGQATTTTTATDTEWLLANPNENETLIAAFAYEFGPKRLFDICVVSLRKCARASGDLCSKLIDSELLIHYNHYTSLSDTDKFLLWYTLQDPLKITVDDQQYTWLAEHINAYFDTYFMPSYIHDKHVRRINDQTIWYFVKLLNGPNLRLFTNSKHKFVEYRYTDSKSSTRIIFSVDKAEVLSIENACKLERQSDNGIGRRDVWQPITHPDNLSFLIAEMLNTCNKQSGGDVAAGSLVPVLSLANNILTIEELSRLAVIDKFIWRIRSWYPNEYAQSWVKLTSMAGAVAFFATRGGKTVTGLACDTETPVIDTYEWNALEQLPLNTNTISILCTNVLLRYNNEQYPCNTKPPFEETFLLHESQPNTISLFIPADVDPAIVRTMVLYEEESAKTTTTMTTFRWVIASLVTETPKQQNLLPLLRDVIKTLPQYNMFVNNFYSLPTNLSPPLLSLLPSAMQIKRFDKGETLVNVIRQLTNRPDAIVLHAKPHVGFYSPTLSRLFWQTEPGFVPWSVPETWRAFTWRSIILDQPIETITQLNSNRIVALLQGNRERGWYALVDRENIARFLEDETEVSLPLNAPAIRLVDHTKFYNYIDPRFLPISRVAGKRVYAFADGTVFVSTKPLMFDVLAEKPLTQHELRYLGHSATNAELLTGIRKQRIGSFERGNLLDTEIWFPLVTATMSNNYIQNKDVSYERCYNGVPKHISPLIEWLDRYCMPGN